jgi:hypothetical protein
MTAPNTTDATGLVATPTTAAPATPATVGSSTAAPIPTPTHAEHAGFLHGLFTALEGAAHLLTNPAVLALLPGKYQGYAMAVAAVEQVAEKAVTPADSSSSSP